MCIRDRLFGCEIHADEPARVHCPQQKHDKIADERGQRCAVDAPDAVSYPHLGLIQCSPDSDFVYTVQADGEQFAADTRERRAVLDLSLIHI